MRHAIYLAAMMTLVLPGPAGSQQASSACNETVYTDPPRSTFRCAGDMTVEVERGAGAAFAPARRGRVERIELDGKAILIDMPPRKGRFQILTPHAIASVRGTVFAVDVTGGRTSVFVAEGRVEVSRRDGSDAVILTSGQGVDVTPGLPVEVKTWSRERAGGLLGRLGR